MRFKISRKEVRKEDVDVDLPCYSRHYLDQSTVYRKLCAGENDEFAVFSIHMDYDWLDREEKVELSVSSMERADIESNGDYYLGRGEFKSSEEDWNEAVEKASQMMERVAGNCLESSQPE